MFISGGISVNTDQIAGNVEMSVVWVAGAQSLMSLLAHMLLQCYAVFEYLLTVKALQTAQIKNSRNTTNCLDSLTVQMYNWHHWHTQSQYAYNKLRVAYNDGFRQLLNEPRWCSASKLFVFNNVLVYAAVTRKLIYSLWCTVFNSANVLLRGLVNSDLYVQSPLFRRWRMILYKL